MRTVVVVVDSTELFNDWRLESRAWVNLLGLLGAGPVQLVVPRVVVRETARHYRRETLRLDREKISVLAEILKDLARVTSVPRLDLKAVRGELRSQRDQYETQLEEQLLAAGARIADVPDMNSSQLLDWAITERKPFKSTGEGFRDALVWGTVIAESSRLREEDLLLLVSRNASDFGSGTGQLADELLEDLRQIDHCPTALLAPSLDLAFTHFEPEAALARSNLEILRFDEEEDPFTFDAEDVLAASVLEACEGLTGRLLSTPDGGSVELEPLRGGAPITFSMAVPDRMRDATVYDLLPSPESLNWDSYDRAGDQLFGTATIQCDLVINGLVPLGVSEQSHARWSSHVIDVEEIEPDSFGEALAYMDLGYSVEVAFSAVIAQTDQAVTTLQLQSVRANDD